MSGPAKQQLESLSERVVKELWDFYPTSGSRMGRHEYDGRLPDLSPTAMRKRTTELERSLAQLSSIDLQQLDGESLLTHRLLDLSIRRELFTITEMRPLAHNPMRQVGYLNVTGYLRRNYAPIAERVRSAARVLEQVPDFLRGLEAAIDEPVGRPVLEMSVESYSGMSRFYRQDLGLALGELNDPATLTKFNQDRESAATAVDGFVEKLQARLRNSSDDFAIGPQLYSKMLTTGEGVESSLNDLIDLGQANLDENLRRLAEVGESISPGRDIREIIQEAGRNHPTADTLLPETRDMLEEIRTALIDLDVISVPSEDRCDVIETPSYMRYAFAAMDSPGSLENNATESYYYVTPVEPSWTAREQEEWLSNFNYDTLRIVSIHEVYPGHFVHHLHSKYGKPLSLVNHVFTSYAFSEGWAHYTEEMMLETDYGRGRPVLRLTQLIEALVRNCRYLCAIWMHTQGMTVDEATRFFMDYAYMGELPARREAIRGTFDPGYLYYTLGKLMILKLRNDYRRERGGAFSLKDFHDQLLSYGAPPLPVVRQAMLRDSQVPSL